MTENTTKKVELSPAEGCITALGMMLLYYALLVPIIMVAWNVGLENAGIVPNEIGWLTALGLALVVTILRGIVAAGRR